VYNRSSFHFAGTAAAIVDVVTNLTMQAWLALTKMPLFQEQSNNNENCSHPTVGIVDHIAVIPLEYSNLITDNTSTSISGCVAKRIGERKSSKICQ
jgi:glutamate formiminotransferase